MQPPTKDNKMKKKPKLEKKKVDDLVTPSAASKVLDLDKSRRTNGKPPSKLSMETDTNDNAIEMREMVITVPSSSVENLRLLGLVGTDQNDRDIIDLVSFTVYGSKVILRQFKKQFYTQLACGVTTLVILAIGILLFTGCADIERKDCYVDGEDCGLVGPPGPEGPAGPPGAPGQDGSSCSSTALSNGALISCSDGTQVVLVNGADGIDGLAGRVGADGADGTDGLDGVDGINGVDGVDGVDGANGVDGTDGANAPPTPYTVTQLIDPCGETPGFNEVLLRLANGMLLAHYSHGSRQFLTVITPGTYTTTQGSPECTFTVAADMTVTDQLGTVFNP
jgi:hypothetical protein